MAARAAGVVALDRAEDVLMLLVDLLQMLGALLGNGNGPS